MSYVIYDTFTGRLFDQNYPSMRPTLTASVDDATHYQTSEEAEQVCERLRAGGPGGFTYETNLIVTRDVIARGPVTWRGGLLANA